MSFKYKKEEKMKNTGFKLTTIKVFDNEKEIGNIEYSYINDIEFILIYSDPINYLNDFRFCNIDKNDSKEINLKKILKLYNKENIDFKNYNINEIYDKTIKKLRKDLYNEIKNIKNEYANKGVVDFVFIEKEYRKKGILEELYKIAYKDLKEKNIHLFSSVCQSKEGKTIWLKLKQNGFDISEDNNRYFINGVNKISKKNKNTFRNH